MFDADRVVLVRHVIINEPPALDTVIVEMAYRYDARELITPPFHIERVHR